MTHPTIEAMLAACIPGGTSADPQQIADAIREYVKQPSPWQPIETAPKGDEPLWGLWRNEFGVFQGVIYWQMQVGTDTSYAWCDVDGNRIRNQPTYYIRLPKPPEGV